MPIVTVTMRKPKSREFKRLILDAVHGALVASGISPKDRFHRVLELDEDNFQFDDTYPDVKTSRTNDFVLVEIQLGVGRTVKVKKSILADITQRLANGGFDPEDLMVFFTDAPWENFSPAGGRIPHA
jgi:phenylpyruvate tautomerase PptA (4-oxalocrotonate tautomerase family)